MTVLRYLLIPAALLAAGTASAQSWRIAASVGDPPQRSIYVIDETSVKRSGDMVDFTTKTVYENTTAERNFNHSLVRRRANCRTLENQYLGDDYYIDDRRISGSDKPSEMEVAPDRSAVWALVMVACGKRDYVTGPIGDPVPAIRGYYRDKPND